jgi:hypothetical protein
VLRSRAIHAGGATGGGSTLAWSAMVRFVDEYVGLQQVTCRDWKESAVDAVLVVLSRAEEERKSCTDCQ